MKVSKVELKDYLQFKDLTIDLTYPKGHKKAGEPLDKICIIGQSGVGKSNLLEIIRERFNNENVKTIFSKLEKENYNEKIYFVEVEKYDRKISNNPLINMTETDNILLNEYRDRKEKIVEAGSKYVGVSEFEKSFKDIILRIEKLENKYRYDLKSLYSNNQTIISIDETAWRLLSKNIENYKKERLKYIDSLSNKLSNIDSYEKKDFIKERKVWEAKNENIAEKISDKLNTILIKFNLELSKIDENQKSYNDLTIKDLSNENIIEYENLSTGTKNLIATFIPLKIYNPKDSIILIDEPENSFYPDIQRLLTELYMEVGEKNQLIFATHSPIIASSFEPWEIVELKFDEDNQVYRELYFEGDRHVDNYFLDPQLLTWTGILMDIFDMKESSNSNLREQKLIEFNILKEEIKNIKNLEEKEKLFKKLQNMGKKLGIYNQ